MNITVPMPPNLTNGRKHWRVLANEKKRYYKTLDMLQLIGRIPPPPSEPFQRFNVEAVMTLGAQMDQDNLLARTKWPMDWFAASGYIKNDKYANWTSIPSQLIKRGGDYQIAFTLSPVYPV